MEAPVDVLANWLWQGSAVALAATAILRASRRMSATTRYHLWWVTLAVVLALPLFSLQLPATSFPQDALGPQSAGVALTAPAGSWTPAAQRLVLPPVPAWAVWLLALVWFGAAAVSLSRTCAGFFLLRRAKRAARPFPEAREARLKTWLSVRARGRRAGLAVSDGVRAAAVLGLTSPAIVVAPGALGVLEDEELDQIVMHEWAHVQRRDDLSRLVQRLVVGLAGLHPAVWWIDRQLNVERETACDDWAVNATGSARRLAVCLTKLASLPGRPSDPALLPAAVLSSELTTRVVRLLDPRRNTSTSRAPGWHMLVAPVLGALALTVASVEVVVTSPIEPAAPGGALSTVTPAPVNGRAATVHTIDPLLAPSGTVRSAPPRLRPTPRGLAQALPMPRPPAAVPVDSREQRGSPAGAGGVVSSSLPDRLDRERSGHAPTIVLEGPLAAAELPGSSTPVAGIAPSATATVAASGSQPAGSLTLWDAAADAGVTVGKGSQKAAVATAGFFTKLSRSFTRVF
jgi:beta-lactamase regulating signal transducer with metallopeptidase domain